MSGKCTKRVASKIKGKVCKRAIRSEILYSLETLALTKRQAAKLEVAELQMLRFSLGVTRMDKIRMEHITRTGQVRCFGDKV